MPLETCNFNGDSLETTYHFKATFRGSVVGCVSFMKVNCKDFDINLQYQLRGMAVSSSYRGQNVGMHLLSYAEKYLRSLNHNFIWCNVRETAIAFYQKQAYTTSLRAFTSFFFFSI